MLVFLLVVMFNLTHTMHQPQSRLRLRPQCPICLELLFDVTDKQDVVVLKCHPTHRYHFKCLLGWRDFLPQNENCPLCREKLHSAKGDRIFDVIKGAPERKAIRDIRIFLKALCCGAFPDCTDDSSWAPTHPTGALEIALDV